MIEECLRLGLLLCLSYGLMEMAGIVSIAVSPEDLFSAGKCLPAREVTINGQGRICLGGATRFLGYLEAGEVTTPFDKNGLFVSSDLGEFDSHGNLQVRGRADRCFLLGGETIDPLEIEKGLHAIAGIARAHVILVPHSHLGQIPFAFVFGREAD